MISSGELADPERSFNRLLFAAQDMAECRAAVKFLLERNDIPGDVRRALETGAVVAYARPWGKSNTIGALEGHWIPRDPKQRALHDELIDDRNKVFAHTDEEVNARWVAGAHWEAGALRKPTTFLPAWRPLTLDRLPEIGDLAETQTERFSEGIVELARGTGGS
jgi:hypothetical protein